MLEKCPKCGSPRFFSFCIGSHYTPNVKCESCGFGTLGSKNLKVLSMREVECINLIKEGNSNKRIGKSLGISEQTIKNHISNILKKVGAFDRAHVVYICMKAGIIE